MTASACWRDRTRQWSSSMSCILVPHLHLQGRRRRSGRWRRSSPGRCRNHRQLSWCCSRRTRWMRPCRLGHWRWWGGRIGWKLVRSTCWVRVWGMLEGVCVNWCCFQEVEGVMMFVSDRWLPCGLLYILEIIFPNGLRAGCMCGLPLDGLLR